MPGTVYRNLDPGHNRRLFGPQGSDREGVRLKYRVATALRSVADIRRPVSRCSAQSEVFASL